MPPPHVRVCDTLWSGWKGLMQLLMKPLALQRLWTDLGQVGQQPMQGPNQQPQE
jgi:hypothetical protein